MINVGLKGREESVKESVTDRRLYIRPMKISSLPKGFANSKTISIFLED